MNFDSLKISDELAESIPVEMFVKAPIMRPVVETAACWALEDLRRGTPIRSGAQLAAAIRDRASNFLQPAIDHIESSAFVTGSPLGRAIESASAQIWTRYFAPAPEAPVSAPVAPSAPEKIAADVSATPRPRRAAEILLGGAA